MMTVIKQWFAPPIFEGDEGKTLQANLLNMGVITFVLFPSLIILGNLIGGKTPSSTILMDILAIAAGLLLRHWLYSGRIKVAGTGLMVMAFILITGAIASLGTIRTPTTAIYMVLVIMAGVLFELRGSIVSSVICSLAVLGLIIAENTGMLPQPDYTVTITQWVTYTILFGLTASLAHSTSQITRKVLVRAEQEIEVRKQLEATLRESENKFRNVIEHSADGIVLIDSQGILIEWNPAAEEISGLKRADVIGQPIWEVIFRMLPKEVKTPALLEIFRQQWAIVINNKYSSGLNHNTESEIETPQGVRKFVQSNGFAIKTDQGTLAGTILSDITERKRTEASLQKNEQFLRTIADNTPALVAYWTRELRCTFANKEYLTWFGRTTEQMQGIHLKDLLGDELFQKNEPYIRGALRGENQQFERTLTKASGGVGYTWAQYISHKVDEEIYGFFVLVTDITPLKQAEMALRDSEEKWRRLFSILPVGVSILNAQREIVDMNPALEGILKITREGLLNKAYRQRKYLHPDNTLMKPEEFPSVRAVQEQSMIESIEMAVVKEDGVTIWTEVSAAPLPFPDGNCVVVTTDITERKLAEIERGKLVAELKTKNAELESFSYTVSHDLKAPLFTIQGFVGFLEKDILAGNNERIKGDVARITSAIEKMQRLLNELLELSRIGRTMNPTEEISFEVIVRDAIDLVAGRIADNHVAIDIALDLPTIHCDRVRLTQVVQNLIENAVKFMGTQPAPHIWIGQRIEEAKPVFFVRDNGIGIAPEYQQRVFGLFDKLDPKAEGTGLGLALVKRIIEAHNGKIWVESEGAATGSTFCFTIPDEKK